MDLLWRRAVEDPRQYRTFCLVHAENLPYHTSDQALQCLHEAMQGRIGMYNFNQFVIYNHIYKYISNFVIVSVKDAQFDSTYFFKQYTIYGQLILKTLQILMTSFH